MGKGEASRRRLLDAAAAEFVAYGIAGSRVDRISATAKVSKAQMYAYFSSKDALFDAVLADQVAAILATVPLTPEDLPGYAARLYDECVVRPGIVRLATWARLERAAEGFLFKEEHEAEKIAAVAKAQADGFLSSDLSAEDMFAMLLSMAMAWAPNSLVFVASGADDVADHARRRQSLAIAVERAFSAHVTDRDV